MVNVIDSAFVEILPDLSRFTQETEQQLDRAFTDIQQSAERSLSNLESSFDDTADAVGSSFDDVDPDFSGVEDSAAAAADDVAASFDDIDPEFSGVIDGATSASDEVAGAFDGTGDEIASEFDAAASSAEGSLDSIGSGSSSAADEASSSFDGVGEEIADEFEEASSGVDALGGAFTGLVAAIGGAAVLTQATLAAEEFESALTILESQVDETGRVAGLTRQQLAEMAEATSIRLGIDDTDLVRAQQSISLFTDLTGADFERTIELSADLGTFMGRELPDAARLLARGLDDPTRGLQLLERQVGQFDEGLVQTVEELTRFGRTGEAQVLILDEIERRFGGVAQASADSTARIRAVGDEMIRTFGTPIIGAIDENVDELLSLGESLIPVAENLGELFGTTVTIVAELSPALEGIAQILGEIPAEALAAAGAAVAFNRALNVIRRNPVIAGLTAISLAIGAFVDSADEAVPSANQLELSLRRLTEEEELDQFTNDLIATGEEARRAFSELDDSVLDNIIDGLNVFGTVMQGTSSDAEVFEERVADLRDSASQFDQQFQQMVRDGNVEQAEQAIAFLGEQMGFTGEQFDRIASDVFPETFAAMELVEEQAENTAIATTDVAEAIAAVESEGAASALAELTIALRDSDAAAADAAVAERDLGIASEDLLEVTPEVAAAFESLAQSVVTSMPSVGSAVDAALATAQEAEEEFTFDNFVEELETAVTNAQNFNTNVTALIDAGFTSIAQTAIERGPEFAAAAADALSDPEVLRDAEGLMDDLATEVDTGLDNAARIGFRGAGDAGERIIEGFESGTRGASSVGRDAAEGVAAGIGQRERNVERAARGAVNGAVSEARRRAGRASGAGTDFASGIISGINGQIRNIESAARNSANVAVAAARGALRAVSPSKRTAEEIGLPFTQGIAVGMAAGQPEVDRAFEGIVAGLNGPEVTAGFSPAAAAATTAGAGTTGGTGGGGGPVLEIRSDGTEMSELLLVALQRAIRIRGGDVQEVLGSERSIV